MRMIRLRWLVVIPLVAASCAMVIWLAGKSTRRVPPDFRGGSIPRNDTSQPAEASAAAVASESVETSRLALEEANQDPAAGTATTVGEYLARYYGKDADRVREDLKADGVILPMDLVIDHAPPPFESIAPKIREQLRYEDAPFSALREHVQAPDTITQEYLVRELGLDAPPTEDQLRGAQHSADDFRFEIEDKLTLYRAELDTAVRLKFDSGQFRKAPFGLGRDKEQRGSVLLCAGQYYDQWCVDVTVTVEDCPEGAKLRKELFELRTMRNTAMRKSLR